MCFQICTSVPSGRRVHLFFLRGQYNINIIFPEGKTQNVHYVFPFFPCFSFLCCRGNVYQSALIPRKLPCLDSFLVVRLYYNVFSINSFRFLMPHRLIDSVAEHLKKHENAKCIDFQFHDLTFSQFKVFWTFMLQQPLTYIWKKQRIKDMEALKHYLQNYHYTKFNQRRSYFLLYCLIYDSQWYTDIKFRRINGNII